MRESRPINALAIALTAVALATTLLAFRGLPPPSDSDAAASSGHGLAAEAIRQLQPGGLLFVIARDPQAFKHPPSQIQLDTFKATLRHAHTTLNLLRTVQVDPLRPLEAPPGDFFELIRKATPGSVIVSFMGPPLLSPEQRTQLGEVRARILAFCPGTIPEQIDLRQLFDAGLLHAALIDRPNPKAAPPANLTADLDYQRFYRLVTAATVASLYQTTPDAP
jgi:hypothetical protein